MPTIKEFREWYLREVQVPSGSKADVEPNFPIQYLETTWNGVKNVYNRLLAKHYATDEVIRKFAESITFKLNPEDEATDSLDNSIYPLYGGLVRYANSKAVRTRSKNTNDIYSANVVTSTLLPSLDTDVLYNTLKSTYRYVNIITSVSTSDLSVVATWETLGQNYKIYQSIESISKDIWLPYNTYTKLNSASGEVYIYPNPMSFPDNTITEFECLIHPNSYTNVGDFKLIIANTIFNSPFASSVAFKNPSGGSIVTNTLKVNIKLYNNAGSTTAIVKWDIIGVLEAINTELPYNGIVEYLDTPFATSDGDIKISSSNSLSNFSIYDVKHIETPLQL